jgi:tRNA dimethylallyltransferase
MQLITILGPTSSGKSQLAVQIAKTLPKSCIVGCDSRQVYQKLDFGTGKINGKWQNGKYYYQGIEHFLIDHVSLETEYCVIDFVIDFCKVIASIRTTFETVILVGGTGLYAKAILDQMDLGIVQNRFKTEYEQCKIQLQKSSLIELQRQVLKLGIELNNSDFQNKIRLVSRILKTTAMSRNWIQNVDYPKFETQTSFCIDLQTEVLKQNIATRLQNRIGQEIIQETLFLMTKFPAKINSLGLEYRLTFLYLIGMMDKPEYLRNLLQQNFAYAKRQKTWFQNQPELIFASTDQILQIFKLKPKTSLQINTS